MVDVVKCYIKVDERFLGKLLSLSKDKKKEKNLPWEKRGNAKFFFSSAAPSFLSAFVLGTLLSLRFEMQIGDGN